MTCRGVSNTSLLYWGDVVLWAVLLGLGFFFFYFFGFLREKQAPT